MKPLEQRSTVGRLTIAINNFEENVSHHCDNDVQVLFNLMKNTGIEIDEYGKGPKYIPGGLLALTLLSFRDEMQKIVNEYNDIMDGNLQKKLQLFQTRARALGLQEVTDRIESARWDILLLINSVGGQVDLLLPLEALIEAQEEETNVTTVATTRANSLGAYLFHNGSRKIALTSTQLLLHLPIKVASQTPIDLAKHPNISQRIEATYKAVLDQTDPSHRDVMDKMFATKNVDDRSVWWLGAHCPGYITDYLQPSVLILQQLANLIQRPVNPASYEKDVIARFGLESDLERGLMQACKGIPMIASSGKQWLIEPKMVTDKTVNDALQKICEEMRCAPMYIH